jgi:thiamine biosynthesis lipoprotein
VNTKLLSKSSIKIIFLSSLLILAACERVNQSRFFGLGTIISVEIHSTPEKAENFLDDLQSLTDRLQKDLYAWDDGELSKINLSISSGQCAENPSKEIIEVLQIAKTLNSSSDGYFEPGIAPLIELWGFHDASQMPEIPPEHSAIEKKLQTTGSISVLEIKHENICAERFTQLDFGAIGKGWAAKETAELLRAYAIDNALIDFGGDLILKGTKKNNIPWHIGLRHPDAKQAPARFDLETDNTILAVFTSGDYERSYEFQGRRYHHILDPETGYPTNNVRSVTVVHPDPLIADAAATALMVAGHDWQRIAKKMRLSKALVVYADNTIEISRELNNNTSWLDNTLKINVVELKKY